MAKTLSENPKTTDEIIIEMETPDADGCFVANPYKVTNLTIYYIERDFLGNNYGEYDEYFDNTALVAAVEEARIAVCDDPTELNIYLLEQAQNALESSRLSTKYYYRDRAPMKVVGTATYPAWLSTDTSNALIELVDEDADGNTQYGRFQYIWRPEGAAREGDYIACWTWTPNPAGDSLSAHIPFQLAGNPIVATTIPTHLTANDKYRILLERYLPEMYKSTLAETDLTPETLDKFNNAVAEGFTFLEDQANQIIDLLDANVLNEQLLLYLSNFFNLKLKSSDPTLWRRQIKEAIPLFKKKGTLSGLQDAFAQAGMSLNAFTQYWQITSPYTWQESFAYDGTNTVFVLEKDSIVTPIDVDNFGLWVRYAGDGTYTEMDSTNVSFAVGAEDYILRMTWIGDDLSEGDIIRVLYEYNDVPNPTEQALEDYIQSLPLSDQRDEADQAYPPKNWNVHLISEADALFNILVPVRHPYQDPLIFGYTRTEFPYGENIYNMEEYNGSTRPSHDPCRMDKDFTDPCGACMSSKYSVDVAIEELSNDRVQEAQDILREYMPFHAQLHSLNFSGEMVEYVQSPVEEVDFLVTVDYLQNILSGQANPFFHRVMEGGLQDWIIDRSQLATQQTMTSGLLGTAYNDSVSLVVVDDVLENLGVMDTYNILEVLAPSANAGTYTIGNISGNTARVISSVIEPVNQSAFTFNLSNVVLSSWTTDITQSDWFWFSDASTDFAELGVKTQWDTTNTPDYTGASWKVKIPAYSATPYEIRDIFNGKLLLDGDSTLPIAGATGVTFELLDDTDATIATGTTGVITCDRRGYVELNLVDLSDIEDYVRIGDYLHYNGDEYEIVGFQGNDLWIAGWTGGDVAGVSINTRRRLLVNSVGYFGYQGLKLITYADHEAEFGIVNGSNPPAIPTDNSKFKENYLFKIGEDYYRISTWDGVNVTLVGREKDWTTLTAGGTAVSYSLIWFEKEQVNVQFIVFDHLDRSGHDVAIREIEDITESTTAITALTINQSSGIQENVAQEEGIHFIIENRDGSKEEGEI